MKKSGYTEDNNISPVRQVAIDILEDLAEMLVDEGRIDNEHIFDCREGDMEYSGNTFWYDCEDMIVEYIENLMAELKQQSNKEV